MLPLFYSAQDTNADSANDNISNTKNGTKNDTNGNTVTLDLRVSCNTFWKYQMNLTINRDEFIESNDERNSNSGNINVNSCFHGNKTPVFSRLERHLCDAMNSLAILKGNGTTDVGGSPGSS